MQVAKLVAKIDCGARLFLHASEISFLHPESQKEVIYKSDLSSDLKETVNRLTHS